MSDKPTTGPLNNEEIAALIRGDAGLLARFPFERYCSDRLSELYRLGAKRPKRNKVVKKASR